MPQFRIREAAELLGVSDDTVRRWIDAGALPAARDDVGRKVIDGVALAEFSRHHAATPAPDPSGVSGPHGTDSSAWSPGSSRTG